MVRNPIPANPHNSRTSALSARRWHPTDPAATSLLRTTWANGDWPWIQAPRSSSSEVWGSPWDWPQHNSHIYNSKVHKDYITCRQFHGKWVSSCRACGLTRTPFCIYRSRQYTLYIFKIRRCLLALMIISSMSPFLNVWHCGGSPVKQKMVWSNDHRHDLNVHPLLGCPWPMAPPIISWFEDWIHGHAVLGPYPSPSGSAWCSARSCLSLEPMQMLRVSVCVQDNSNSTAPHMAIKTYRYHF